MKLVYPEDDEGREARRRALGDGPWNDEPDLAEWESHGLSCRAHRSPLGVWCGYVTVPRGHPWYGMGITRVPAEVHWGITYAQSEGDAWRVGFDCGHCQDMIPALAKMMPRGPAAFAGCVYRSFVFVREETESLAAQAADAQRKVRN